MSSRWTYKVTRDESRGDGKKQRINKHRSPLAYVEEAPCVAELRYLAVRRTFGWRGAAAAYAKSAGGFLNSAAKSAVWRRRRRLKCVQCTRHARQ